LGLNYTSMTTANLSVSATSPGFTLTPAATTMALKQNQGSTDVITAAEFGGVAAPTLAVTSTLPAGLTVGWSGNTLAVFAAPTTATGTYPVTITGTSGTTTATTTVTVTVSAMATFSITPTATTVNVSRLLNAVLPVTDALTIARLNGFTAGATMTAAVTGVPSGGAAGNLIATVNNLGASSVTPSTVNLSIRSGNVLGALGSYTVTITGTVAATGTSNAFTVTKTVTVNVVP
jgi:hypothetical protein